MAVTINASTSAGLVNTADTSGVLALQTAGTTAVSISASQVVTLTNALAEASGGTGTTTGYYGFKNRIINGAMVIDQRNAGASVTPTNAQYLVDRWSANLSQASKYSVQQNAGSVTPPTGFINYLGVTSLSAYSIVSTDTFGVRQRIEGLNTTDFAWGTANAETVTLSFWVRSSLTGTFGGALQNSASNRSYPFSYTINSANTWEKETITIAGDTSGTWLTTNGIGIEVYFGLGVGSTYSGTAGSWAGANYSSATGATSVVGTSGATFYITGVQLEKGSTATSFDYRPYGTELVLCLRYYWRLLSNGSGSPIASGNAETSTRGYINLTLPQPMRTQPSSSISNISHLALRGGGTDIVCTSGSFSASTSSAMATIIGGEFNTGSSTGATAGGCVKMDWNSSSAWIDASAEL